MKKITSLYPSATPNVLSSMYSGLLPAEHGALGTEMPLRGAGSTIHVYRWTPYIMSDYAPEINVNTQELFPKSHLINEMVKKNDMVSLCSDKYVNSIVTKTTFDCELIGCTSLEDIITKMCRLMDEGKRGYIFAYWDEIDRLEHQHSNESVEVAALVDKLLSTIDKMLLPSLKKNGYNLVVAADHGQTKIMEKDAVHISSNSEIMKYLTMDPWCDKRFRILSARNGKENAMEECFEEAYGKFGDLFESEELIKSGIFGATTVPEEKRWLFGTHVIIPKGSRMFVYDYLGKEYKNRTVSGQHSSLTPDEMYVPNIVF